MSDKLKQANENIEILIKKVLQFEMTKMKPYCYFSKEKYDNDWNCDDKNCSDCRDKYYNNIKEDLYKQYIVKE